MTPVRRREKEAGAFLRSLTSAGIALCALCALCCGCQHQMSKEESDKAVAAFKGGPPGPDEAQVQAKERATAEAYRKAHPEEFPPSATTPAP